MKRRILMILIAAVMLVFSLGITYSFFTSNASGSANQNIARFIFNTESLEQLQIPLIDLKPGTNEDYLFSVSNNYLEHTSEVSIKYLLTIKTYHIVPLSIELYKIGDEEELILTCDENHTRNDQNELVCNTQEQLMNHSTSRLDNYKLKVIFPNEYNSSVYADLVDYINIEIKSWQITEEQVVE